jgi:hypothetical protein
MGRGARGAGRGKVRGTSDPSIFDPTDIFEALNAAQVRYLVVGGIAVVLYGIQRTTGDVDLCVHLTTDNLGRLANALQQLGFVPRVPTPVTGLADAKTRKRWTREKGMKVYSFIEPYGTPPRNIDIMVNPVKNFGGFYRKRKVVTLRGTPVPLMPVGELARMKRRAGRPQDLQDVQDLRLIGRIS